MKENNIAVVSKRVAEEVASHAQRMGVRTISTSSLGQTRLRDNADAVFDRVAAETVRSNRNSKLDDEGIPLSDDDSDDEEDDLVDFLSSLDSQIAGNDRRPANVGAICAAASGEWGAGRQGCALQTAREFIALGSGSPGLAIFDFRRNRQDDWVRKDDIRLL